MKKVLSLMAVVLTIGLTTAAMEAEAAKRMGSGKSMGMQRQTTQDKAPSAPTQASAAAPTAGAAGAAAAPSRSWMGPIAGLAAGLGIAALASHLGFGGELASMIMMGLLIFAVIAVVGFFIRKRAGGQQPIGAAPPGMQYARLGGRDVEPTTPAYKVEMPGTGTSTYSSGTDNSNTRERLVPANFDVAGFERNAKVNFIRLQASNDAGNLDDIREFTTPEMYSELKMEIAERGHTVQKGDVASINAEVLDVEETNERHIVSVRFTGTIAYDSDALDETFDEIWHLTKPRDGKGGWVVSGIQQTS